MSRSEEFFHGSTSHLKVGDILQPGLESNEEEYQGRAAHATTDFGTASLYAGGQHLIGAGVRQTMTPKRGNVYRVEPVDANEMRQATSKLNTRITGHVASEKGFRVLGVATRPDNAPEYPKLIEPDNS